MSSQPVEANVVLSADNTQYNQAMNTSAQATDGLGASVDSLGRKIHNLSKMAGKSLIGISAGDVALITGATAAWSSYEKQVSRLQAQSAILTKTTSQQTALMKDYTNAVMGLRKAYGTTTAEASNLVQTLSKITTIRQSRDLADLSKVFIDMSHATGESSEGLASSLTNLQKVMGTPINSANTRKYADQFTYLAAQTQISAQGLIDFTAQMAPVGRQIGIHSNQMAGFATAFAKAGQDSGPAALVFTKITGDIAHSLQTGSSEIAHYANIIGVTNKQFKSMDGAEQVVRILESLQQGGKAASTELSRLGLDGPRSLRAITSVIQAGGFREVMGDAKTGKKSGAAAEGSKAAETLSQDIGRLQEQSKMFAETMGEKFAPAVQALVQELTKLMGAVNAVASGPLGDFLATMMEIGAPVLAGAGALLLFAGALMKVASAFAIWRSSARYGLGEGLKGGASMMRMPDGSYRARGAGETLGPRGANIAQDPNSTPFQRGTYNAGQMLGSGIRGVGGFLRDAYIEGRTMAQPGYVAGPMRNPLSYVAGGIGRGMDAFVTPGFDQMRYANVSDRTKFIGHEAPWTSLMDRARLSRAMGNVGATEYALQAQRAETTRVHADPLLTNQERQAKLDSLRTMREETMQRRSSAMEAEKTAQQAIVASQGQTEEVKKSTVGFTQLGDATKRLGGGMVGGTYGAAKAGAGLLARSPMAMPIAGMLGMGITSAAGVDSKMLQLGAMGMMFGSPLAAGIGAGIGAGFDAAGANNAITASQATLSGQVEDARRSGYGFADLNTSMMAQQQALVKQRADYAMTASNWFGAPKSISTTFGSAKNAVEGVFGSSDTEEAQAAYDASKAKAAGIQAAARDLARTAGHKLTGTARNQRNQLDQYMSGPGAALLADAGIDPQDLVDARTAASTQGQTQADVVYKQMLDRIAQGVPKGATDRVAGTAAGRALINNPLAQKSIVHQEDVGAFYDSIHQMFDKLKADGLTNLQIMHSTALAQNRLGYEDSRQFDLLGQVGLMAQQSTAAQMPFMTSQQRFGIGLGQLGAISNVPTKGMTQTQMNNLDAQKQAATGLVQSQVGAIQQALLAQDQFDIQKERAQESYDLQRSYAEHDYQLQRSRAEESFNRSRNRAQTDYNISVARATYQFYLQRSRQENDFQHQVEIQTKQTAMAAYDIYQRVSTQRTSSASMLLSNAGDQLQRMRQQEQDLNKVRRLGLSDTAIQQLKLTDPANQQQLARFVTELTPKMIKEFNKTAGGERLKAARDLVTDSSSLEWREMQRSQRISMRRAKTDFDLSMAQGHEDFERGLHRQRQDFNIMMDQQAEDFSTMMGRQEKQYQITMKNAAEDLANMGKEISGSIESILTRGTKDLTGNMQKQAAAALSTFTKLKESTSPIAVSIMKELSSIFGFEYKVPKVAQTLGQQHMANEGPHAADGAIMPGWTPGRDVMTARVSGGEAIMRPEWARAVGHETVNAMNHQAKYGGFADGGMVNPDARVYMDGEPVSKITKAQLLLAEKLSHMNLTTMQGSWQPYTAYSGSSHMGPGVVDEAPGNFRTQYWLRRVGFAAWGRNFPGAATAGSGAHVHAVSLLDPGASHQSQIPAFYAGQDGLGGLDYGPNPGMLPGLRGMLAQFSTLAALSADTSNAALPRLGSVLKQIYPSAEAAAYAMQGVHPLNPGDISSVINDMARKRYAESLEGINPNKHHSKWYGAGGVFTSPTRIGVGESGNEAVIPLNDEGVNFLARAIHGAEARGIGMGSTPMGGGTSIYNTRIDRSTNFTGAITVQANNPHELIHKLQARQRVMALSRPSLTGSSA